MSARAETKVFGIRIGVDPKIVIGVLVAVAAALIWFNTRPDEDIPPSSPVVHHDSVAAPAIPLRPVTATRLRRGQTANDRDTLRLRPIDATRGDVDPTLRLDLLAHLQNVPLATGSRSLFEAGPPPLTPAEINKLKNPPTIPKVNPAPAPTPPMPVDQPVNIPLKYYGFVNAGPASHASAGLFLDGDNIVVGSEGDLVMKKYLIVALTPASARLEDTQLKKGQTLTVVPAATP